LKLLTIVAKCYLIVKFIAETEPIGRRPRSITKEILADIVLLNI